MNAGRKSQDRPSLARASLAGKIIWQVYLQVCNFRMVDVQYMVVGSATGVLIR